MLRLTKQGKCCMQMQEHHMQTEGWEVWSVQRVCIHVYVFRRRAFTNVSNTERKYRQSTYLTTKSCHHWERLSSKAAASAAIRETTSRSVGSSSYCLSRTGLRLDEVCCTAYSGSSADVMADFRLLAMPPGWFTALEAVHRSQGKQNNHAVAFENLEGL